MSYLIALIFDDPLKGEEARAELQRMTGAGLLEIDDIVLIRRSLDGRMSVAQERKRLRDQNTGHVLGLVAAAVTGTMPRDVAGRLAGRLVSRLMDHGVTRTLIAGVRSEVEPGKSALIVQTQKHSGQHLDVAKYLRDFGPKVMERDVPSDLLDKIESETKFRAA